jgi:hypothetical protein
VNLVEIVVKVKDDAAAIGKINNIGQNFARLGILASGVLGGQVAVPLAAAGLAMGAFAAVAMPTLDKIKKALTLTGTAGTKAWAALDPAQKDIARNVQGLQHQFQALEQSMMPVIDSVVGLAVKTGQSLMPAFGALARAGAIVITSVLRPMNKLFQSDFFGSFIKQMSNLATQVAPSLGKILVDVLRELMKLFEALGPQGLKSIKVLADILQNVLYPAINALIGVLSPIVGWLVKMIGKMAATKIGATILAGALTALGIAWLLGFGPVGWAIGLLAGLVVAFKLAWSHSQTFRNIMTKALSAVGQFYLTEGIIIVNVLHGMADAFLTVAQAALTVAAMIPGPWQKTAQKLLGSLANFRQGVDATFNGVHQKLEDWKTWLANAPKMVKLQGNIDDLESKLARARKSLGDHNLTRTRRAQIEANIARLLAAIARAKAELASIRDRTVYINYATRGSPTGSHYGHPQAAGGIIGAAAGGIRSGLTMVGEHGRELISGLPAGSRVWSNPDTERMMGQSAGGGPQLVIQAVPGSGMSLDALFWRWLREFIRVNGGGDVQKALGQN